MANKFFKATIGVDEDVFDKFHDIYMGDTRAPLKSAIKLEIQQSVGVFVLQIEEIEESELNEQRNS